MPPKLLANVCWCHEIGIERYLCRVVLNYSLISHIDLVAHQELINMLTCIAVNFLFCMKAV